MTNVEANRKRLEEIAQEANELVEVLIARGISQDNAIDIGRRYAVNKLLTQPSALPEVKHTMFEKEVE